jgi:murein DD-endopeptidase MepM/ murein hydrolase activator NlpD
MPFSEKPTAGARQPGDERTAQAADRPDQIDSGQDNPSSASEETQPTRFLAAAWRGVTRAWLTFRGDKVTPVRVASHLALLMMAVLVLVLSRVELPTWEIARVAPAQPQQVDSDLIEELAFEPLPLGGSPLQESGVLVRAPVPFTLIPDRPREGVITYTVQIDDTVLGIAEQFNLNPNTIVWANLEDLKNPFVMEVGQILLIPPIDGVLHTVKEKDTIASVAKLYKVTPEAIVEYAANELSSVDDALTVGAVLIVPNGDRTPPEQLAVAPSVPRGGTGTSAPWRAAGFVWPAYGRLTQRFWLPAHPAIDIGAPLGTPVYAADAGTVTTAGWSSVGYGNMILIRHNDGFVTLYAHLSRIDVSVGDAVARGQRIGAIGSTGRSTGPHLHFEIQYGGRSYNPLVYLP